MSYQLNFTARHAYDTRASGITLPLTIKSGSVEIGLEVKLDPGSTFCIFQRLVGERLGFDIERGTPQRIGTTMGSFLAYGHEVTLITLGIEIVATVYFAAQPDFPVNVVGRVGLLDRTRLGLVDYDGLLYLSDYHDLA